MSSLQGDQSDSELAAGREQQTKADVISAPLVALLRGVLHRDQNEIVWQALLAAPARVREYVGVLGLELILDEAEGYAYLRQRISEEDEPSIPRLVQRRQLSYPVSLLLALLRKKLAEHDASGAEPRLVLSLDQIVELVRVFAADSGNEARLVDRLHSDIKRVVELGFLRPMKNEPHQFEVRRILKAFVDAQWLAGLEQRLAEYRQHVDTGSD